MSDKNFIKFSILFVITPYIFTWYFIEKNINYKIEIPRYLEKTINFENLEGKNNYDTVTKVNIPEESLNYRNFLSDTLKIPLNNLNYKLCFANNNMVLLDGKIVKFNSKNFSIDENKNMEKISGAFSFYLPFISSDPVLYTEKGSENCIEVSKSRMSNSDISFETLHSFPIDFTPKEYSDFVKGNYKKISTSTIDTINSSLKMKASDSYFFPIYMLIFIIWSNFILLFKKIINFFEQNSLNRLTPIL